MQGLALYKNHMEGGFCFSHKMALFRVLSRNYTQNA